MALIYCVEDDDGIRELISCALKSGGYEVKAFPKAKPFYEEIRNKEPSLVLLDIMLPKLDGLSVCQQIREFSDVPIIMLTAKGDDMDKILGLEYGADDYITKPFNILEVKARMKAILRRNAVTEKKVAKSNVINAVIFILREDRLILQPRSSTFLNCWQLILARYTAGITFLKLFGDRII